jgi:hypothetical protein
MDNRGEPARFSAIMNRERDASKGFAEEPVLPGTTFGIQFSVVGFISEKV